MNSTRHKARTEGIFHHDSENEKPIRVHCYKNDYKNNIPCRIEFFDSIEDADKLLHKSKYNNIFYFDNKSDRLLLHECGDIVSTEESTIKIGKKESQTAYKESEGKLFFELDWGFIKQMAERMASNKKEGKYSLWNWKKPMTPKGIEDLKQASMRHLLEIMEGRYEDDGREFGHIEALADNMMMLNYQLKNIENTNTNNS